MSIIGTGFGLRRRAQEGMSAVAKLEAQENQQRMQLDAARQAQEMQMYGTFGGIGAQQGVPKAIEAYKATKAAALKGGMSPAVAAPVTNTTAALGTAVPGANVAATGKAGAALTAAVPGAQAGAGGGLAASGAAAGGTAAGGAAAGGAAAGSGSAMLAGLSAIAAPLAIGLGAAYLINKLFD